MKKVLKNKGFTLIELLVVLAIIGILIALAIVGLRAAQAAQRDTARKDIASQINAALQSWQSTNGTFPTNNCFLTQAATNAPCNGNANGYFIVSPGGCSGNAVNVNGSCVGMNSLSVLNTSTVFTSNAGQNCTSPSPFTNQNFYLCYDNGTGSAGYVFGVPLESGSTYWIAQ